MKCKSCGADINPKSEKCEYCGSYIDHEEPKQKAYYSNRTVSKSEQKRSIIETIIKSLSKIVIAWIAIWAVLIVVVLLIVLNSDLAKNRDAYTTNSGSGSTSGVTRVQTMKQLPANQQGLFGKILQYNSGDMASIEYDGKTVEEVKILDKKLTDWLTENDRHLDQVGIYFDTDSSGNITTIGLSSDRIVIIDRHGNDYVGIRGDQILCFSAEDVKVGEYYTGYFTYPDMKLIYKEKETDSSFAVMDPVCTMKDTETCLSIYTEKEIKLYEICVSDDWYYCSKEVYDKIQEGDKLDNYEFHVDPKVILAR